MGDLLLKTGKTEFWHALVTEAQHTAKVQLSEDTESYLVFLLMRYINAAQISTNVVALDYFNAHHEPRMKRRALLRDVGDKCLIFAGLFPGMAKKRRVKVSYFIKIGRSAYRVLGDLHKPLQRDLFASLSQQFVQLTDVLHAARQVNPLEPLQAYELWEDTHSKMAQQSFNGLICRHTTDKKKLH